MTNYSETITIPVTPEMKNRAKESEWRTQSEYGRQMIRAGESNIAALDPRTTNQGAEEGVSNTDDVEELAQALDNIALLNELSDDPQPIKQVLGDITRQFQSVLANRLDELASNEASPVQRDPLEDQYYIDTEE